MPESFFNKVPGLGPAALLKKSLWHRFFPANLVKFQRTPSLLSTSWRLLLNHTICTWMSLWQTLVNNVELAFYLKKVKTNSVSLNIERILTRCRFGSDSEFSYFSLANKSGKRKTVIRWSYSLLVNVGASEVGIISSLCSDIVKYFFISCIRPIFNWVLKLSSVFFWR